MNPVRQLFRRLVGRGRPTAVQRLLISHSPVRMGREVGAPDNRPATPPKLQPRQQHTAPTTVRRLRRLQRRLQRRRRERDQDVRTGRG